MYGALDGDECCGGRAQSGERDVCFRTVVRNRLAEKVTRAGSGEVSCAIIFSC